LLRLAGELRPLYSDTGVEEVRRALAVAVRKLPAITCLDIPTDTPDWLEPCIAAWPALGQLSFRDAAIDRGTLAPVVAALSSATSLRRLDLAAFDLSFLVLSRTLPTLVSLTRLGVCSFLPAPSTGAAAALCAALPVLSALAALRLNKNACFFNGDVAASLGGALRQLPKLSYLDLGDTNLSGAWLRTMTPSIAWAALLEELQLPDPEVCTLQAVADLVCALPAHHRLRRMCRVTKERHRIRGVTLLPHEVGPWPVDSPVARHALAESHGVALAEHVHAAPHHAGIAAILLGEGVLRKYMMAVRAARRRYVMARAEVWGGVLTGYRCHTHTVPPHCQLARCGSIFPLLTQSAPHMHANPYDGAAALLIVVVALPLQKLATSVTQTRSSSIT
jgi:hypothetical protein